MQPLAFHLPQYSESAHGILRSKKKYSVQSVLIRKHLKFPIFIRKPVDSKNLARIVRSVLDGK
jgi:hypothetical protein